MRAGPRRSLPAGTLERIVHTALPHCRVLDVQPLVDGLRNANFKIQLDADPGCIVLRIYEHDASLCQKELDLMRLVRDAVPVPEVLHAEPRGWEELPPFTLTRYIEGIPFRELKRSGDLEAIAEAARSAGETLATIGRVTFPKAGWLAPGPSVTAPLLEGANAMPRFVDLCLSSAKLQERMPEEVRARTHELVWLRAAELVEVESEARLVHGDFNKRNLLVRQSGGRWVVAGVLDWEFAISGSPLNDIGNFLRYERASQPRAEPHFSSGYLCGGGKLPEDWRALARIVDLTALCESLTHDEVPETIVAELVELVRATAEQREPRLE